MMVFDVFYILEDYGNSSYLRVWYVCECVPDEVPKKEIQCM